MKMKGPYEASLLPIDKSLIDTNFFLDELIDATASLEVYREKIRDSKLASSWFMPTLQNKEALASSSLEGTQATLDGVLTGQILTKTQDQHINEVINYNNATLRGYEYLSINNFSKEFINELHGILMKGDVRKRGPIGEYRREQNYIGKDDETHAITYIPPEPGRVEPLMKNLISYITSAKDNLRPLVRIAIIHAQFESIHPFMDGNGRVGRMLIPMYLYKEKQIDLPCFFISEALEKDKLRYYSLLNDIRDNNAWSQWIKFFLATVAQQCRKYIDIITAINNLYEKDLKVACDATNSANMVDVINLLYKYPIINAKKISDYTGIPQTTVQRYLGILTEKGILFSNNKKRYRVYQYSGLLSIIR